MRICERFNGAKSLSNSFCWASAMDLEVMQHLLFYGGERKFCAVLFNPIGNERYFSIAFCALIESNSIFSVIEPDIAVLRFKFKRFFITGKPNLPFSKQYSLLLLRTRFSVIAEKALCIIVQCFLMFFERLLHSRAKYNPNAQNQLSMLRKTTCASLNCPFIMRIS